jgi:hypothetical protein
LSNFFSLVSSFCPFDEKKDENLVHLGIRRLFSLICLLKMLFSDVPSKNDFYIVTVKPEYNDHLQDPKIWPLLTGGSFIPKNNENWTSQKWSL